MNLSYGAQDAFDAAIFGEKHPNIQNYLQNQFQQAGQMLVGAGQAFYDQTKLVFEHFNSNAAVAFARSAVQKLTMSKSHIERITYLFEEQQLRNANVIMQRWIMACPQIRERYLDQRIDGYSDTYHNAHGRDVGWLHYDYRRAVNGLMQETPEGDTYYEVFHEELPPGERELNLGEQIDIRDSWIAAMALFVQGKDPTDPLGGGAL